MPESSPTIQITVNGEPCNTAEGILIPDFLDSQEIRPDRVVVEWNGAAQTRAEAARIRLSAGDRLEVVRIVAGG
jgi:thiamine biosynthesis protein ThiS